MADNHTTNHLWQEMPSNLLLASQTRTPSEQNSENITKADFNREVHVDIRSIANESDQARHYEIPEAVEINEDENQEHSNDELIIVDARPLPWYIRIDFWKLCVIAILIVSAFAVAIVLLSKNLSSSSTSDINLPIEPHDAPTSFPTYVITTLPTYEPSFKTSTQSDKEYIAMQRDVLKQYYIETDGENSWYRTENWLNDEVSVCKWYGCECNNIDIDIVTSFDTPGMSNPQQIPTVVGMLSKLEVLTIDGGSFVGTLPSELFRLHQLKRMKVISTMEGMLPSEIGELRSLEYLELRENRFDGQIPTELGLLQSLTYLDISDHKYFTEPTIPSELGNLSLLKKLYMSHNGLLGTVPSELFGLVSLEELNLSWNSLNGSLPLSMELISLREMDLSNNKLSGMLPGSLGSLESLEVLKANVSMHNAISDIRDIHTMFSLVDSLIRSLRLNPDCLALPAGVYHHGYLLLIYNGIESTVSKF